MKVVYGPPIPTADLAPEDREALKARVRAAVVAGYDPTFQSPS